MGLRDCGQETDRLSAQGLEKAPSPAAPRNARGFVTGGTLFEELGFYYVGPIDGHNLDHCCPVLRNVRDNADGPVLIHVVTQKGKGYAPAENSADKYHGVAKFDVVTGAQAKAEAERAELHEGLRRDADRRKRRRRQDRGDHGGDAGGYRPRQVRQGVHPSGTFDVGIAEQHAVTFAAGMAPRAEAVLRDLFHLPAARLRPGRPRRGDPETARALPDRPGRLRRRRRRDPCRQFRHGLSRLPAGLRRDGGGDEAELAHGATAPLSTTGPIAFRYPRGEGVGVEMPEVLTPLEIGKGRVIAKVQLSRSCRMARASAKR
jgi:1-deoxy-D-xylulose-5-phosphate synthase